MAQCANKEEKMGEKEYVATQAFKRKGRRVQTGDIMRLSEREALYLSLAGKVAPGKTEDGGQRTEDSPPKKTADKKTKKKKRNEETPSAASTDPEQAASESSREIGKASETRTDGAEE
jgi:hypothetical protein